MKIKKKMLIIGWRTILGMIIGTFSVLLLNWEGHPILTQLGRIIWIGLFMWVGVAFDNYNVIRNIKR